VDSEDVDGLDFESNSLDLSDDPVESARGVGSGEDVLVHEESPIIPTSVDEESVQRGGAHQMRSSYCQVGRIPATWKTKIPSSSRRL
jgi:hypothetical protein